eukprot:COSAG01_NODE_3283_length_6310_cov_8.652391_9_plen_352_part_00
MTGTDDVAAGCMMTTPRADHEQQHHQPAPQPDHHPPCPPSGTTVPPEPRTVDRTIVLNAGPSAAMGDGMQYRATGASKQRFIFKDALRCRLLISVTLLLLLAVFGVVSWVIYSSNKPLGDSGKYNNAVPSLPNGVEPEAGTKHVKCAVRNYPCGCGQATESSICHSSTQNQCSNVHNSPWRVDQLVRPSPCICTAQSRIATQCAPVVTLTGTAKPLAPSGNYPNPDTYVENWDQQLYGLTHGAYAQTDAMCEGFPVFVRVVYNASRAHSADQQLPPDVTSFVSLPSSRDVWTQVYRGESYGRGPWTTYYFWKLGKTRYGRNVRDWLTMVWSAPVRFDKLSGNDMMRVRARN